MNLVNTSTAKSQHIGKTQCSLGLKGAVREGPLQLCRNPGDPKDNSHRTGAGKTTKTLYEGHEAGNRARSSIMCELKYLIQEQSWEWKIRPFLSFKNKTESIIQVQGFHKQWERNCSEALGLNATERERPQGKGREKPVCHHARVSEEKHWTPPCSGDYPTVRPVLLIFANRIYNCSSIIHWLFSK